MNHAPHLPTETCRVDTHARLQSLGWFLIFVAVAVFTGITGALITTAWISPSFVSEQIIRNYSDKNNGDMPDQNFILQSRQRVVTIYDKRKNLEANYFSPDSVVANNVLISSDGWSVGLIPNYSIGQEKNWEAMDYQGAVYPIEKAVVDNLSRLVYVKLQANGFRIASFANYKDNNFASNVWNYNGNSWSPVELEDYLPIPHAKKNESIWKPQYYYSLKTSLGLGSLFFSADGSLVGIVNEDNQVIPADLIEIQIDSLLQFGAIRYSGLDLSGSFVERIRDEKNIWRNTQGFYITDLDTTNLAADLAEGEVILKVNDEPVSPSFLAYQILQSGESVKLTVLRDGEEVEVVIKKVIVN